MPTWNKRDDHVNFDDLAEHIQSYLRDEADIKIHREVLRYAVIDLFKYIAESIKQGDRIILRDFGTFYRSVRKGYTLKNHPYIDTYSKPDRYIPKFKPSRNYTKELAGIQISDTPDRPKKGSRPKNSRCKIPYPMPPEETEYTEKEELIQEAMEGINTEGSVFADYDPLTSDFLSDYTSAILDEVLKKGHKDINLQ